MVQHTVHTWIVTSGLSNPSSTPWSCSEILFSSSALALHSYKITTIKNYLLSVVALVVVVVVVVVVVLNIRQTLTHLQLYYVIMLCTCACMNDWMCSCVLQLFAYASTMKQVAVVGLSELLTSVCVT